MSDFERLDIESALDFCTKKIAGIIRIRHQNEMFQVVPNDCYSAREQQQTEDS